MRMTRLALQRSRIFDSLLCTQLYRIIYKLCILSDMIIPKKCYYDDVEYNKIKVTCNITFMLGNCDIFQAWII